LIVQNHIEQPLMDPDAVIVFNKAELAKSIHEEAHAGPGGADPGGNCCRTEVIERENAASLFIPFRM
jgi:hypothetical protein